MSKEILRSVLQILVSNFIPLSSVVPLPNKAFYSLHYKNLPKRVAHWLTFPRTRCHADDMETKHLSEGPILDDFLISLHGFLAIVPKKIVHLVCIMSSCLQVGTNCKLCPSPSKPMEATRQIGHRVRTLACRRNNMCACEKFCLICLLLSPSWCTG